MKLNLEIRFGAGFEVGNICSNLETSLENNLFENWRLKFSTFTTMFPCANLFPTSNQLAFNSIWTWKHLFELGNIYCELGKSSRNVHKTILKTQLPRFQPFSRTFSYPKNVSNFELGFPTSSIVRVKSKLSSFKLTLVRTVVKVKWRSVWVLSE